MPYPIGDTRVLLDRDRAPMNNLEVDICSLSSASLDVVLSFWLLNHQLYLFGDGPQKSAQFTGNGGDRHLLAFAFGQQPSEAGT